MFGLGFMEILFIAIVAIIFLGPDKLPGAMVEIAKFIKSTKSAIVNAKNAINDEVNIEELKREALGYKEQLDSATHELQGFKNLNPANTINEELSSVKDRFASLTQLEETAPTSSTTQVEPKQEEVTFKKKTVTETTLSETKEENKGNKN